MALSPFSPQIDGSISADLLVNFPQSATEVSGSMGISDLYYGKQRVGNFNLNVDYQLDSLGRQEAQADLEIDDKKVLTLNGLLDNQAENPVRLNLSIDDFPLATANPFLPSEMSPIVVGKKIVGIQCPRFKADNRIFREKRHLNQ